MCFLMLCNRCLLMTFLWDWGKLLHSVVYKCVFYRSLPEGAIIITEQMDSSSPDIPVTGEFPHYLEVINLRRNNRAVVNQDIKLLGKRNVQPSKNSDFYICNFFFMCSSLMSLSIMQFQQLSSYCVYQRIFVPFSRIVLLG